MLGTYALSAGYYDAFYGQAQKVRTLIIREHREAFESFDVLACPTSPTVALPMGERAADPLAMYASDLLTIPSCLAGLPGLSIPCGLSEGLPVGLQLVGPQFSENRLFAAGHALERALGCEIAPRAVFARKNYFYPDLSKGYQISQYDLPACIDGKVLVPTADGDHLIGIVRAHLEEGAAQTLPAGGPAGRT